MSLVNHEKVKLIEMLLGKKYTIKMLIIGVNPVCIKQLIKAVFPVLRFS